MKGILTTIISCGLFFGSTVPGTAATYRSYPHYQTRRQIKHRQHVRTARRVGVGAAGGAAIGALAGGGKGAGIGALAGAGAGALYDRHKRHEGK